MNLNKLVIALIASILIPISLQAQEIESGSIAVIDVEVAIFGTEASKQAFEELAASKEWKEVEEDLQLKINEATEIQEKLQKEGPTMSDDEKLSLIHI